MTKPWYKSKTKLGSVLVGGSVVLSSIGSCLLGQIDGATALKGVATGLGMILVGTGLRDAIDGLFQK